MEGGIDSSHVSFLHRGDLSTDPLFKGAAGNKYNMQDLSPVFEVTDNEGGLLIGARRNAEDDQYYWRITPWVMPCYTGVPPRGDHPMHGDMPHDWRLYIDAIERFRAHEGLGQVDVVGTSMGGAFAAAYAATYPDSVRRIVLLSPAGVVAPNQNDFMARVAAGELPLDIKDDASFGEVLRLNFPDPPPIPAPVRQLISRNFASCSSCAASSRCCRRSRRPRSSSTDHSIS